MKNIIERFEKKFDTFRITTCGKYDFQIKKQFHPTVDILLDNTNGFVEIYYVSDDIFRYMKDYT